ncbi:MAG: hypothetical protein JSW26_19650 [Desulfobacterales bacterium]|nr:MAG: hypothetical protein JSW26_19650 [Desulfobacterales bacterium]
MRLSTRTMLATALLITSVLIGACASDKPFLIIHYQLPSSSQALEGQKVSLTVTDARENKAFLGESAKKSLRTFNDTYSLVVLKADGSGNLLGIYNVDALISEIFRQRLANMGMQVTSSAETADHELEIRLKDFKLDLAARKWVVNMNYRADLIKDGSVRATETISGSAERLKLRKKNDAEKVLSELLTDMANKLDLARLFQQAQR